MGRVVQITQFRTTDGQVFDTAPSATRHQCYLNLRQVLITHKGKQPGGIGINDLFDLMQQHPDEFWGYLSALKEEE